MPVESPHPRASFSGSRRHTESSAPDPGEIAVQAGLAERVGPQQVRFVAPPGVPAMRAETPANPADRTPPAERSGADGREIVAVAPAPEPVPDVAALAEELYERIESRLREDLLLERERRGLLPDPFRSLL
jgi:hypothetical protein